MKPMSNRTSVYSTQSRISKNTANLHQGNEGRQFAQSCYAVMSGTAARDESWTRHVLVMLCSLVELVNHYNTAPHSSGSGSRCGSGSSSGSGCGTDCDSGWGCGSDFGCGSSCGSGSGVVVAEVMVVAVAVAVEVVVV